MSATGSLAGMNIETNSRADIRLEPALGLVAGLGGALQSLALGTPIAHGLAIGGTFGLVFGAGASLHAMAAAGPADRNA